ncbi:hypothetical protein FNF29_05659 [Cafeteria roenbergensis]|uniref:diphosphoinositol-pentakisphosphate 1-kinase n=2 Tax=Cafeteria roenbergensis TaxID=33653 RepID=A0A5A8CBE9_CAFRO|nr:hypothetical protein FNF29_05659 [Cafeteria roenbergensis]|eukprot:KAA0149834.1 hypothetical protein FNF29_05659 [Cafeteria roenbergensis]
MAGSLMESVGSPSAAAAAQAARPPAAASTPRPRSSSVDKRGRNPGHTAEDGVFHRIRVGICAMDKKARSKPMTQILSRVPSSEFEIIVFGNDRLLKEEPEAWPVVDCFIAFFSKGFPIQKAERYVQLRRPFCVNDLSMEYILRDRRLFYKHLASCGVPVPPHLVVSRGGSRRQRIVEHEDSLEVDGDIIYKPFVEKPADAEDHNIMVYFPRRMGGGCKHLFRKVGNKSSQFYRDVNRIRAEGSYIYEQFLQTSGTDIKVYAVGPDYAHAEARKSPVVDGIVQRDGEGKELRFPIMLTPYEKEVARRVVQAFRMNVCGLDLLRTHNKTYVCDVNGWSFVKKSTKYYDDVAELLTFMMLRAKAPHRLRARDLAAFSPPAGLPTRMLSAVGPPAPGPRPRHRPPAGPPARHGQAGKPSDSSAPDAAEAAGPGAAGSGARRQASGGSASSTKRHEELRCVLAVIRHGDRTPKQKMKMKVSDPRLLALHRRHSRGPRQEAKLKSAQQLQVVLETVRKIMEEEAAEGSSDSEGETEQRSKLMQLRAILERGGRFHGINRKVQLKPTKWRPAERPATPEAGCGDAGLGGNHQCQAGGDDDCDDEAERDGAGAEAAREGGSDGAARDADSRGQGGGRRGSKAGSGHGAKDDCDSFEAVVRESAVGPSVALQTAAAARQRLGGHACGDSWGGAEGDAWVPPQPGVDSPMGNDGAKAGAGRRRPRSATDEVAAVDDDVEPCPAEMEDDGADGGDDDGDNMTAVTAADPDDDDDDEAAADAKATGDNASVAASGSRVHDGESAAAPTPSRRNRSPHAASSTGGLSAKSPGRAGGSRRVIGHPPWEGEDADRAHCDDDESPWDEEVLEAQLVLKWGGVLTEAGRRQAEELGRRFRSHLFPGESTGLLRLHATYRHDLKIYSSDEGRVQMTAAAFTRSFLALDGELTPILAALVRNANTQALLDDSGGARPAMDHMKELLREGLLAETETEESDDDDDDDDDDGVDDDTEEEELEEEEHEGDGAGPRAAAGLSGKGGRSASARRAGAEAVQGEDTTAALGMMAASQSLKRDHTDQDATLPAISVGIEGLAAIPASEPTSGAATPASASASDGHRGSSHISSAPRSAPPSPSVYASATTAPGSDGSQGRPRSPTSPTSPMGDGDDDGAVEADGVPSASASAGAGASMGTGGGLGTGADAAAGQAANAASAVPAATITTAAAAGGGVATMLPPAGAVAQIAALNPSPALRALREAEKPSPAATAVSASSSNAPLRSEALVPLSLPQPFLCGDDHARAVQAISQTLVDAVAPEAASSHVTALTAMGKHPRRRLAQLLAAMSSLVEHLEGKLAGARAALRRAEESERAVVAAAQAEAAELAAAAAAAAAAGAATAEHDLSSLGKDASGEGGEAQASALADAAAAAAVAAVSAASAASRQLGSVPIPDEAGDEAIGSPPGADIEDPSTPVARRRELAEADARAAKAAAAADAAATAPLLGHKKEPSSDDSVNQDDDGEDDAASKDAARDRGDKPDKQKQHKKHKKNKKAKHRQSDSSEGGAKVPPAVAAATRHRTQANNAVAQLLLTAERWRKLVKDVYSAKKDRFDLSKLPDIYDCVKHDILHSPHIRAAPTAIVRRVYNTSRAFADIVIPQEYGVTSADKFAIGSNIAHHLLRKIFFDLTAVHSTMPPSSLLSSLPAAAAEAAAAAQHRAPALPPPANAAGPFSSQQQALPSSRPLVAARGVSSASIGEPRVWIETTAGLPATASSGGQAAAPARSTSVASCDAAVAAAVAPSPTGPATTALPAGLGALSGLRQPSLAVGSLATGGFTPQALLGPAAAVMGQAGAGGFPAASDAGATAPGSLEDDRGSVRPSMPSVSGLATPVGVSSSPGTPIAVGRRPPSGAAAFSSARSDAAGIVSRGTLPRAAMPTTQASGGLLNAPRPFSPGAPGSVGWADSPCTGLVEGIGVALGGKVNFVDRRAIFFPTAEMKLLQDATAGHAAGQGNNPPFARSKQASIRAFGGKPGGLPTTHKPHLLPVHPGAGGAPVIAVQRNASTTLQRVWTDQAAAGPAAHTGGFQAIAARPGDPLRHVDPAAHVDASARDGAASPPQSALSGVLGSQDGLLSHGKGSHDAAIPGFASYAPEDAAAATATSVPAGGPGAGLGAVRFVQASPSAPSHGAGSFAPHAVPHSSEQASAAGSPQSAANPEAAAALGASHSYSVPFGLCGAGIGAVQPPDTSGATAAPVGSYDTAVASFNQQGSTAAAALGTAAGDQARAWAPLSMLGADRRGFASPAHDYDHQGEHGLLGAGAGGGQGHPSTSMGLDLTVGELDAMGMPAHTATSMLGSSRRDRYRHGEETGPFLVGRPETAARFEKHLALRSDEGEAEEEEHEEAAAAAREGAGSTAGEEGGPDAASLRQLAVGSGGSVAGGGQAGHDGRPTTPSRTGSMLSLVAAPAESPGRESALRAGATSPDADLAGVSHPSAGAEAAAGEGDAHGVLRSRTLSEDAEVSSQLRGSVVGGSEAIRRSSITSRSNVAGSGSRLPSGSGTSGRRRRGGRGLHDIARDFSETVHKLDSRSMSGAGYVSVKTPQRHVRTRLYFTSESHVHALVNVLRCAAEAEGVEDVLTPEGRLLLGATPELDYCTHIVFRLYERLDVAPDSPGRHRAEILFSPGACMDPLERTARPPISLGAQGSAQTRPRKGSVVKRTRGRRARLPLAEGAEDVPITDGPRTADDVVKATQAALLGQQQGKTSAAATATLGGEVSTPPSRPRAVGGARRREADGPMRYLSPLPMVALGNKVSLEQLEQLLSGAITQCGGSPGADEHRKVRQKTPLDMANATNLIAAASGALA